MGIREITKALQTSSRQMAIPIALSLGAQIKTLFNKLRGGMGNGKGKGLRIDLSYELTLPSGEKLKLDDVTPAEKEFAESLIRTTIDSSAQARQNYPGVHAMPIKNLSTDAQETRIVPMLSELIAAFLANPETVKAEAMLGKHNLVLPIITGVLGDKPVDQLRQSDIVEVFNVIRVLPTYWFNDRKKGMSFLEIAKIEGRSRLAESAFSGTYRASIGRFLGWAVSTYQDQGFPTTLTLERIKYTGDRKKGQQQKQRAFTLEELKRLFEGPEMKTFAANTSQAHMYWLPHIGLFTGARINEICQINPQTDIRKSESGIWYFLLTEDTEAGEGVRKNIKTGVRREVPVHKKLLELGLLTYVERIKSSGAKVIFPQWKPKFGRASGNAVDDFIDFLKSTGIHGIKNELGYAIRGSHAFRHTLLSYGKSTKPVPLNLRGITGHKQRSDNAVADGYEDETIIQPLIEKQHLLDRLEFNIKFHSTSGQ